MMFLKTVYLEVAIRVLLNELGNRGIQAKKRMSLLQTSFSRAPFERSQHWKALQEGASSCREMMIIWTIPIKVAIMTHLNELRNRGVHAHRKRKDFFLQVGTDNKVLKSFFLVL